MQSPLTFLTRVTRWSRSSSNFYALIGQNLTGKFTRIMCAASGTCFLIAQADRVLCRQLVKVFNCLFPLDLQNEYSCNQDSSVIHGTWKVNLKNLKFLTKGSNNKNFIPKYLDNGLTDFA